MRKTTVRSRQDYCNLKQEDYRRILTLLDRSLCVDSLEGLRELWQDISAFLDCTGAVFALSRNAADPDIRSFELITFGIQNGWADSYRTMQLMGEDPFLSAALVMDGPITWQQAARLAIREERGIWRDSPFRRLAINAGLRHGMIYARHSSYSPNLTASTALSTGLKPPTPAQIYLASHLLPHLNEVLPRSGFQVAPDLSCRELEVLKWCAAGKSSWEMARILNIAERTVKFHLRNIYRKLGVGNRAQAISKALRMGLVVLD